MKAYTYDYLEKNGRLGNQLWQIAATHGEAKRNDGFARFKPNWEYRNFFSVPDNNFESIHSGVERVDGGTDYFQEFHYIENVVDDIYKWFQPSEYALKGLEQVYFPLLEEVAIGNTFISVHVRRGDYLEHPRHFPLATTKYYSTAVSDLDIKFPGSTFLVFSDDIPWCKDNTKYLGLADKNVIFIDRTPIRPVEPGDRVGEPSDQFDLLLMARTCCAHIISNSTFAWWGAFLSRQPTVIYPDHWFGPAVPNWKTWELAIPPGWSKYAC